MATSRPTNHSLAVSEWQSQPAVSVWPSLSSHASQGHALDCESPLKQRVVSVCHRKIASFSHSLLRWHSSTSAFSRVYIFSKLYCLQNTGIENISTCQTNLCSPDTPWDPASHPQKHTVDTCIRLNLYSARTFRPSLLMLVKTEVKSIDVHSFHMFNIFKHKSFVKEKLFKNWLCTRVPKTRYTTIKQMGVGKIII